MATTTTAKKMTQAEAITRAFELGRSKVDASCYGALERGTAMVKNGGVRRDEAGLWHVRSSKHPGEFEVNGACKCPEAQTAWQGNCEHLLATKVAQGRDLLLARGLDPLALPPATAVKEQPVDRETGEVLDEERLSPEEEAWQEEQLAQDALREEHEAQGGQVGMSPDVRIPPPHVDEAAGASEEPDTHVRLPARFFTIVQGVKCVKYTGLLRLAHEQGLQSLTAEWTFNDDKRSLARAVAVFQDGRRFVESGDSTPESGKRVGLHWRRLALTRAKARCLRDALGFDDVSEEEMH